MSKLKAELNHKFEELSAQTARVSKLEKEKKEAATMITAEELVKLRAQLLDVVSREQAITRKIEDTRLKMKEPRQKFSQADAIAKYQQQWADKAVGELQKMAARQLRTLWPQRRKSKLSWPSLITNSWQIRFLPVLIPTSAAG